MKFIWFYLLSGILFLFYLPTVVNAQGTCQGGFNGTPPQPAVTDNKCDAGYSPAITPQPFGRPPTCACIASAVISTPTVAASSSPTPTSPASPTPSLAPNTCETVFVGSPPSQRVVNNCSSGFYPDLSYGGIGHAQVCACKPVGSGTPAPSPGAPPYCPLENHPCNINSDCSGTCPGYECNPSYGGQKVCGLGSSLYVPPIAGGSSPTPVPPPAPCVTSAWNGGRCMTIDTAIGPINTNPVGFVKSIFGILLSISGGAALIFIIFSGYRLMTSQGNPEKLQAARETLTSAIIGLLFVIFSMVILQIIGVDILNLPGFL